MNRTDFLTYNGRTQTVSGWANSAAAKKARESSAREPQPWLCGYCFFLNHDHVKHYCQSCGQKKMPAAHSPEVKRSNLEELARKPKALKATAEEKSKGWLECVFIAANSGKKIGAAFHMYSQRYGIKPHHSFDYLPRGKVEWNMSAKQFVELWKNGQARALHGEIE